MKKIILLLLFFTTIQLFAQTGPGGVGTSTGTSTLGLWLRGDKGVMKLTGVPAAHNDDVEIWKDQSGYNRDATQSVLANRPNYDISGMAGRASIKFTSSVQEFFSESYPFEEDFHIYMVAKSTPTNWSNHGVLASARGSNGLILHPQSGLKSVTYYSINNSGTYLSLGVFTPTDIQTPSIYDYSVDHTSGTIAYVNGYNNSILRSGTATQTRGSGAQSICFGKDCLTSYTRYLDGQISEIMIYNAPLNSTQNIIINNYLAAKYSIALSANDLYDEDDPTNGDYDYDVAGIGRISASNLHNDSQGTGIVRILNPSNLDNDEFLIWGHNNGVQQATNTTDVPNPVIARFDRVWRASEVNTSKGAVDVGAIDIRFDLTGLAVTPSDLRLLVDTNNDGVFSDETPISGASSLGGNIYAFTGVTAIANNLRFTLGTISGATPLPIELLSFEGYSIENNWTQLEWTTASERNSDYFTVERSSDGKSWKSILIVEAAGSSNKLLNYSTIDTTPITGINYYRLRLTDFDGAFTYSKIIEIKKSSNVSIFPNPVKNEMTITGDKIELLDITICNAMGQNVSFLVSQTEKMEGMITYDFSNLESGMYYIQTKSTTHKVLKY